MTERVANYKINNATFRVAYGDITRLSADALVSSDDTFLSMGGGVSRALLREGGESIRREARKLLPLNIGDVAVTSAGELAAKYIFHVVTMDTTNMIGASEENIRAATLKCMQLADSLGVRVIAFPALGTGRAGFPMQLAAERMTRTMADYLLGQTRIELVIITLFTLLGREAVKESYLNLFYERAVAIISVSTQAKRLNSLLGELAKIVGQMNNPALSKHLIGLQSELANAQELLSERPENLSRSEDLQDQSRLKDISNQVVALSSEAQDTITWADKQLEAEVLRTKLNGLYTRMNIHTSHLNRFQIEKAKYGGQLVPPRLEIAIEEINNEIEETDVQIKEVRGQLIQLVDQFDN